MATEARFAAVLLLPALAALLSAAAVSPAHSLNAAGMKLYRAGQLKEALARFDEAIQQDDEFALAHYNRAATLGALRKKSQDCDPNTSTGAVLEELGRAVHLDPSRKIRAQSDDDFTEVRNTVAWALLMGLTLEKDTAAILQKVTWYPGPGSGFMEGGEPIASAGATVEAFKDAGVVVVIVPISRKGKVTLEEVQGRYETKGAKVTVRLQMNGREVVHHGVLEEGGHLSFDQDASGLGSYWDEPDNCNA